eukprot:13038759-Heterocapsa_arctica.AAC.1
MDGQDAVEDVRQALDGPHGVQRAPHAVAPWRRPTRPRHAFGRGRGDGRNCRNGSEFSIWLLPRNSRQ